MRFWWLQNTDVWAKCIIFWTDILVFSEYYWACEVKIFYIFFHITLEGLFFWEVTGCQVRLHDFPLDPNQRRNNTFQYFALTAHHQHSVSTASANSPHRPCVTSNLSNSMKYHICRVLPPADHLLHWAAAPSCLARCLCTVFPRSWLARPPVTWNWTDWLVSSSAQVCLYPAINLCGKKC